MLTSEQILVSQDVENLKYSGLDGMTLLMVRIKGPSEKSEKSNVTITPPLHNYVSYEECSSVRVIVLPAQHLVRNFF
jgi:hypothetical protein